MANRHETQRMLDLTCAMWDDPLVYFYQNLDFAPDGKKSVFLVGPSSREDILEYKWRAPVHHLIRQGGFDGVIYVPEPRENDWSFKETFPMEIIDWEIPRVLSSTLILSWFCRHPVQLPGRVTATETAFLAGMAYADPSRFKERLLLGHPTGAWKVKSDMRWAAKAGIQPYHDQVTMCKRACELLKN